MMQHFLQVSNSFYIMVINSLSPNLFRTAFKFTHRKEVNRSHQMSCLTHKVVANRVSSKTNAVSLFHTNFPQPVFPKLFSTLLSLFLSLSSSSSSYPCFFHCSVSPTELLWAHTVPSATDLLHSRAMFIKETRESAGYGLSHITYSISPEAEARHQSKHVQNNPLNVTYVHVMVCHYLHVKYKWVLIWDRWINCKTSQ